MKGHKEVIATLNIQLADELTAINQYMVHSEMCADWGYGELHEAIEKRAITEMRHAEKLIGRILFLDGKPIVSELNPLHIGGTVEEQLANDLAAELGAVEMYNKGIRQAAELGDNGTRSLLESILADEEDHADWIEAQLDSNRADGHSELPGRAGGLKDLMMTSAEPTWKKYLTDYNEGLGLVYERFVLNDFLLWIKGQYGFHTVLEAPLYGMAGVSGINTVHWRGSSARSRWST